MLEPLFLPIAKSFLDTLRFGTGVLFSTDGLMLWVVVDEWFSI